MRRSAVLDKEPFFLPDGLPVVAAAARVDVDTDVDPPDVRVIAEFIPVSGKAIDDSGVFGELEFPADPDELYDTVLELVLVLRPDIAAAGADLLRGSADPAAELLDLGPEDADGYPAFAVLDRYHLERWGLRTRV
ncbi:MAG: hypothetical protein ACRD0G_13605 [Acidimicrobiales bacterium]